MRVRLEIDSGRNARSKRVRGAKIRRYLSDSDRADFTWFFECGREALAQLASSADPALFLVKQPESRRERTTEGGLMTAKSGQASGQEPDMDGKVDAARRYRRVEATLRELLRSPEGEDYLRDLHDAYIEPRVIANARAMGRQVEDGERLVIELRNGYRVQENWKVLAPRHKTDTIDTVAHAAGAIPGLVCIEGSDLEERYRADLELACRAYEQAADAVAPRRGLTAASKRSLRRLLTKAETARVLGVSRTEIGRMIESKRLPIWKRGERELVLVEAPEDS